MIYPSYSQQMDTVVERKLSVVFSRRYIIRFHIVTHFEFVSWWWWRIQNENFHTRTELIEFDSQWNRGDKKKLVTGYIWIQLPFGSISTFDQWLLIEIIDFRISFSLTCYDAKMKVESNEKTNNCFEQMHKLSISNLNGLHRLKSFFTTVNNKCS